MKRFIDIHVPVSTCNLKCHYCYVAHEDNRNKKNTVFIYDCDIIKQALTQERLGGACHFNVCGEGETLIPKEIVDMIRVILEEGHYIMIVTNGLLTERFKAFCQFSEDLRKRLGFKFSFHYLEMKNKGLLQKYVENIRMVKLAGMSISIEMTPCDEIEPLIPEIKRFCIDNFGALCHITIPRDMNSKEIKLLSKHSIEEFYEVWKTFQSEMFEFKYSLWGVKRNEYCYAGVWSGLLDIGTGDFSACYVGRIHQNIFEDPSAPIQFMAIGHHCTLPHCYNGHSFLGLGDIPSIKDYKYSQERDRQSANGECWLNDDMREFLSHRLEDFNDTWNIRQKISNDCRKALYYGKKVCSRLLKK